MPRLLYLSAILKLHLLYLSELQQLGIAKLFAAWESFLAVTFSDRMPKDLESTILTCVSSMIIHDSRRKPGKGSVMH